MNKSILKMYFQVNLWAIMGSTLGYSIWVGSNEAFNFLLGASMMFLVVNLGLSLGLFLSKKTGDNCMDYEEFRGKVIDKIINNEGNIIIEFKDGSYAEVYNCGAIINGDIEMEIDLIDNR